MFLTNSTVSQSEEQLLLWEKRIKIRLFRIQTIIDNQ